jgi:hypothetical protein
VKKLLEVVDEHGHPTMISFHRVIRVYKGTSVPSYIPCLIFDLDGGLKVAISDEKEGERAWSAYREWVRSL